MKDKKLISQLKSCSSSCSLWPFFPISISEKVNQFLSLYSTQLLYTCCKQAWYPVLAWASCPLQNWERSRAWCRRPGQQIQDVTANPPTHIHRKTHTHQDPSFPPSIPPSLLWCLSDVITSQDNGGRKREMDGDREKEGRGWEKVCVRKKEVVSGHRREKTKLGGQRQSVVICGGRRMDTGVSDWKGVPPPFFRRLRLGQWLFERFERIKLEQCPHF